MTGFHFSKLHVFKIRGGRVVDEREISLLKLLIPSMASILASTVSLFVEVVGNVSSSLSVPGTTSIPVATVSLVVGVVGASVEPSKSVEHQVKENGIDEWQKVAPKRALEDEGDDAGSASFKRSRMVPPQETAG
ncbi:hypothetical protein Fot_22211 [Forsythia ovata]|uniref:Uncharacterized protein n=1 Tax=Forsythia ovata TaxID=205694 RepID=A0ABD1UYR3_9LAMI